MNKKDVLDYARGCESYAVKARQPFDSHWQTYYDFYIGRHWKKEDSLDTKKPKSTINYCQSAVNLMVALLTDTDPRLTVDPFDSSDLYKADFLKQEIRSLWNTNKCRLKLAMTLLNTCIFGAGFWKIYWDEEENDIRIIDVHPKYCFPSSDATSLDNISSFFQIIPLSAKQFNRQFPDWANKVKPYDSFDSAVKDGVPPGVISGTFNKIAVQDTTGERVSVYPIGESDTEIFTTPLIIVKEFWYWDEDTDGYRVALIVGNRVLDDNKGRFPYVQFTSKINPGRFWGISEIAPIAPLQRDINVLSTAINDHIRLCCNTPWITDTNSGVKAEKMTNLEAVIISKAPGTELRRDAPPSLPSDIFRTLADKKFELDTLTGIHDVTQGRRPVGLTAGIAISELQEAAQVPIRFKARLVQESLRQVGGIILDEIKENYKGLRLQQAIKGINSKLKTRKEIQEIEGKYDISFDIESSFVTSRSAKINNAIQLFTMGLIDKKAALESMDYPDREEILARMAMTEAIKQALATGMIPGLEQIGGNVAPGMPGAGPGKPPMVTPTQEEMIAEETVEGG